MDSRGDQPKTKRNARENESPRFSSWALRLAATAGGLSILSAGVIVSIVGFQSENVIRANQDKFLHELAKQVADRLDIDLYERFADVQFLAEMDRIRDPRVPVAEKRQILSEVQSRFPEFAWIGITDEKGSVRVATAKLLEGADVSQRPWFIRSLEGPFVGDVHEAVLLSKLLPNSGPEPMRFVDLAAPIVDGDGKKRGVVGAHLSWKWAKDVRDGVFRTLELSHAVEMFILGKDGRILLGSEGANATDLPNLQSGLNGERSSDEVYITEDVGTAGRGEMPSLGWKVVVRQKADVALAPARELQKRIMMIGLFTGFVFALLGAWLGHWIVRRLVEANRKLEQATRAKSEFLAQMSHEIRTPLNGVIGMLELLLDSPLSEDQVEKVATAMSSSESLLAIINDILDFSKIEAGKMDLEAIEFDVSEVLGAVGHTLSLQARQKNLTLKTDFSSSPDRYVVGDPGRVRQILLNLVSNAIKFTHHGEVSLRITSEGIGSEGVIVRFEIRDTGIGISEEAMAHMFQAFSQADSSTSRKFGGTGLGLSICQRLVSLMGGRIGVESKVSEGSLFWVELPMFLGAPIRAAEAGPVAPVRERASFAARILVVEDNPVNMRITRAILERAGYEVFAAENGIEALRLVAENSFDLIIMDCQMPQMDGYEATRRLRSSNDTCSGSIPIPNPIPILGMTASVIRTELDRCLEVGMNAVVTKPIKSDALVAAIERELRHSRNQVV